MRASILAILAAASLVACAAPPPAPMETKRDPGACATCHMPEFQTARHHLGERPTTCGVCHLQAAWHPERLAHPFWELTGAHAEAKCFGCHAGTPPVLAGTSKTCVDCHRSAYEKAPDHVARFPTTCEECHTTSKWKPTLPEPEPPPSSADAGTSEPERPPSEPIPSAVPSASGAHAASPNGHKTTPKPKPSASAPPALHPPPDATTGASRRWHR